jgi:mono/diheme cytochrome c family protein
LAVWLLVAAAVAAAGPAGSGLPPPASRPVDYARDVQPIFARACYGCHGPRKQRSGLRLDVKAKALKGGDLGPAILPGKGADSPLIRYVAGLDPDVVMPPKKADRLSLAEVGLLRAWIDQGAPWPEKKTGPRAAPRDGWSLRPLTRPAVPRLPAEDAARVRNPIDAFVAANLREQGLRPSPEADRRTLIRRLSFDLVGLPPTPEEVEAFVADPHPDAYERLVERLLASPHYGERWARHWLDVVHFGETHGYDKDKPRPNAWPYRDYVIRAFNDDRPFGRFVQEQVAGDVLFPGTRDSVEALGFLAAGPWDFIGHAEVPETKIDGRVARHLDRDDMVVNTVQTFTSLTVQCAQCHDHKFDPITQEDYYSLQAVFAAIDRTDRRYDTDPVIARKRAEWEARQRALAARRGEVEGRVARRAGPKLAELDRRIAALRQPGRAEAFGYHSGIASKQDAVKWVQVALKQPAALAAVVLHPCRDDFNNIGDGFGFPLRYKVEAADDPEFRTGVRLLADHTAVDVHNPGVRAQMVAADGKTARYVRVTATKLAYRLNDFIFALSELEALDGAGRNVALGATVTALDSIEAPPRWGKANLVDGYYPGVEPGGSGELQKERVALLEGCCTSEEKALLAATGRELAAVARDLAALPPQGVVYAGAVHSGNGPFRGTGPDGGRPRPIHILSRGNVLKPGKEVGPGAIQAVGLPARFDLPAGHAEGERRAALARWLSDRRNPLTWRSIVNRVWHYHFGRGLVETANDFGRNGQPPTHPELLDWLAADFRDGGQSLKALHRLIVTSATYRQSSQDDPACEAVDAGNRFLWRMNRRRLEAEAVRDGVLAVAGALDRTMYGPSFQDFVIDKPEHSPHYEYDRHDPEDPKSHRRAVYRFIVRSQPEPFMAALDCADPSIQVDRRNESLSALQALTLLNDDLMIAMARDYAAKLERGSGGLEAKVGRAYYECLGRPPSPADRDALAGYARKNGLANLCRVLFNLNEFAFVD